MNTTVFALTLRELASQRRSLLILLLAAVPVGLAVLVRIGSDDSLDRLDWTANTLMTGTVITTVVPLACLLLGTSAFGNEVENGTMLYLLTKPVSRVGIVIAKFAASVALLLAFLVPATAISGVIALGGSADGGIVFAFSVAVAVGILAYTALFTLVSLVTSRALLIGLVYVFLWEALITELFSGTAYVSIRQYCLGIAELLSNVPTDVFDASIAAGAAPVLALIVTLAALSLAVRSLERFQITATE